MVDEKKAETQKGEIFLLPGVSNYHVGKFHFKDEMMILTDPEEIKEFQAHLKATAVSDQYTRRIRMVQPEDDSLKLMKQKLIQSAVSGIETADRRPGQFQPKV